MKFLDRYMAVLYFRILSGKNIFGSISFHDCIDHLLMMAPSSCYNCFDQLFIAEFTCVLDPHPFNPDSV
jgi:hypothetical protein